MTYQQGIEPPYQALNIEAVSDGKIRLAGELDVATVPRLRTALAGSLARRPARLILDLTELDFCDSTGLALLVQTRNALPDTSELILHGATDQMRRLLRITCLDTTFTLTGPTADRAPTRER